MKLSQAFLLCRQQFNLQSPGIKHNQAFNDDDDKDGKEIDEKIFSSDQRSDFFMCAHTHAHKHTHTLTHIHTQTRIYTRMYTKTHTYTHVCTQRHTHTHTHVCTQRHTHTHTHTHTCSHTCTHAFTHVCGHRHTQNTDARIRTRTQTQFAYEQELGDKIFSSFKKRKFETSLSLQLPSN